MKPKWWFKSIHEAREDLKEEPEAIEYLIIWTGETYIHTGGTAFWGWGEDSCLNIDSLNGAGITHYRVVDLSGSLKS